MKLNEDDIVYDERARDGTWCCLRYPNHPHGCPNFPDCVQQRKNFLDIKDEYEWHAVIEKFDLKEHADKMKGKHPDWSERQCRNLLYWQGGVRKRLREKAEKLKGDIILDIPEACGINVFRTMMKHGVKMKPNPDFVKKVMFVGFNKDRKKIVRWI